MRVFGGTFWHTPAKSSSRVMIAEEVVSPKFTDLRSGIDCVTVSCLPP